MIEAVNIALYFPNKRAIIFGFYQTTSPMERVSLILLQQSEITLMKIFLTSTLAAATAFLLFVQSSFAQLKYEERIEFELSEGYDTDFIIPQGKSGFLIIAENKDSKGKETEWQYDYYNNKLEKEDSKSLLINKKFNSIASYENDEATYSLYTNKKGEFEIIAAKKESNKLERTKGKLPKKFGFSSLYVLNDYAYLVGTLKKSPTIFAVDLERTLTTVIPINIGDFKPKNTEITNFQVKPKNNEFLIFVKGIDNKRESEMYMLMGEKNKLKGQKFRLGKTGEKNLISISASKIGTSEYTITGTYGVNSVSTSSGIFFGKVDKRKVSFLKFTKFLDLKDFLSYLPERKQEKIEKKRKRKKKRGKDVKINYNIADHDVIETPDGGFILVGEAYYATYRSEARTTFVNGQATTTYVTVFDGYQYTHAIVTKFSANGELEWDNSFKMYPSYKPFTVKRFISLYGKGEESLNLAYADESKIHTKSINNKDGEVLSEKESEEIKTAYEGDKTKRSSSRLKHWYEEYFIVYGYQKIKNKGDNKDKRGKRKVFFVNKVKFES